MKKFFLFFAVILAVLSASSQKNETTKIDPAFMMIYNQVLELNKDRFANINLIQVSDTVLFPARSGQGVEYWVADAPQNGTHDCVWILTKKYLEGDITTIKGDKTSKEQTNWEYWKNSPISWLILAIIFVAILLISLNSIIEAKNHQNPDAYPPVLGNIKPLNDTQLAGAIQQHIDRDQKITKIERGVLIRNSGPKKIKVDMEFGDGKNRWVYLKSGERVTKVTIENPDGNTHAEFWREHCGNYFAVIKRGRVELPEGWEFKVNSTASIKEEKPETKKTSESFPATTPTSVTLTDGQQITNGTIFIQEEDEGTRIAFLILKNEAPEL
ncbi:MAG: hypothetical protein K9M44_03275 [Candidatus Pacebacteria bacterium]|nr:hypothetical protein [Candidatus Paceibacterota bacterium]